MDLTKHRKKLIGDEQERAVSPVIGVILMVAITVILAAVIAAFVLDMGDSMGDDPVNAAVGTDLDNSDNTIEITIEDAGDASSFVVRSSDFENDVEDDQVELTVNSAGSSATMSNDVDELENIEPEEQLADEGELSVVAIDGDSESVVSTQSWDWE